MPVQGKAHDLDKVWERFVSGEDADLSILRPEIAESWGRCRAMQIDPMRNRAPQATGPLTPFDEDLTHASGPVVSFLNDALVGAGTLIDLTNRDARILLTVGGNRALDAAARINGLPGSLWDESAAGTTVIGTAVVNRKPMEIKWQEHYVQEWHNWSCCSAPIFHPFHGDLIGILAIAGFRETAHPRVLELSLHASGLITDSIRKLESQRRLVLVNAFEDYLRRYPDAAIVAVDASGYVAQMNGRVAGIFGTPAVGNKRVADMLGLDETVQVPNAPCAPREVTVRVPSGSTSAVVYPVVQDTRVLGSIVLVTSPKAASPRPLKQAWSTHFSFSDILGESESLGRALHTARNAAGTDYPILLIGESGTGKELFAHAVHDASIRRGRPFVAFNCGTLSPELAVAEMCGYEPGSFTGADRRTRNGVLDMAHGGTLFLDELQDMDRKAQSLLLRFLETGTFVRVGGSHPIKADVRVIAASNIAVAELEHQRLVRPDLLYRLNCIVVEIPPLRERPQDIRLIGERCLRQDLRFTGEVEDAVWAALRAAQWPGNVRELRNALLRATLACTGNHLRLGDLPSDLLRRKAVEQEPAPAQPSAEYEALSAALRESGGDMQSAARRLGIHRSTLYRRMARCGIKPA